MPDIRLRMPWNEVVVIAERNIPALLQMWLDAGGVPIPAPWVPTFEPQHVITNINYGSRLLNREKFATLETATEIMRRFKSDHIVQVPYSAAGPADATDAKEWWAVWPDGIATNAGELAAYYLGSPEDAYPDAARKQAQATIDKARSDGKHLPAGVV